MDMEQIQVMQHTLRGVIYAVVYAVPGIDRARFAHGLSAMAEHREIHPLARDLLTDLGAGMTAIAPAPGKPS